MRRKWTKSFYFINTGCSPLVIVESKISVLVFLWMCIRRFSLEPSLSTTLILMMYYMVTSLKLPSLFPHVTFSSTPESLQYDNPIYWAYMRNTHIPHLTKISKGRPFPVELSLLPLPSGDTPDSFNSFRFFQAGRKYSYSPDFSCT